MPMPRSLPLSPSVAPDAAAPRTSSPALRLHTFSYAERAKVLAALSRSLDDCGCWVLERKATSLTQLHVGFEVQLRSAVDLYSALIAAGLELTRGSHLGLTGLCTVRKHQRRRMEPYRVVEVGLDITFLEELDASASVLPVSAVA